MIKHWSTISMTSCSTKSSLVMKISALPDYMNQVNYRISFTLCTFNITFLLVCVVKISNFIVLTGRRPLT